MLFVMGIIFCVPHTRCSERCHNIHRKTPVVESFLIKPVTFLKPTTLLKRDSNTVVSL